MHPINDSFKIKGLRLLLLLLLSIPTIAFGEITDGYPTGRKMHMVGGANSGKPYVGFILNRNEAIEDNLTIQAL